MFSWSDIPLVRLIIPFIIGILSANYVTIDLSQILLIFAFGALAALATTYIKLSFSRRWLFGLYYLLFVFIGGIFCAKFYVGTSISSSLSNQIYLAQITDYPDEKAKTYKLSMQLFSFNETKLYQQQIIAYAQKDTFVKQLNVGDYILFKGTLNKIDRRRNPATFDYASYLSKKNVFHQVYLSSGSWKIANQNSFLSPLIWAKKLQRSIRELFTTYVSRPSAQSILFALVLGDKTELDSEVSNDFAVAGAMHILAVSGLHVGIIYKVLDWLLILLLSGKRHRNKRTFLLIFCLWLYAFITGLSPSVLRAVWMFSFITYARSKDNAPSFYNTLAASAFIILIIEPNYIYHVGFQLSYSAVIAIVSIYPLFYKHLATKYKIPNAVIGLIIVSIAAQIGTAPFAIYYFHQFPTYFIITNLIAIPAAFLLLSGGLLLIPLHFITTDLAQFIGIIIDWLGVVLVNLIERVSTLPNANYNRLWIDQWQLLTAYLFLAVLVYTISNYWKRGIFIALVFLIASLFQWSLNSWGRSQQQLTVLYSVHNANVIGFVKNRSAFVFTDNDSIQSTSSWNFQVQPSLDSLGVQNVSFNPKAFNWLDTFNVNGNTIFSADFSRVLIRRNTAADKLLQMDSSIIIINTDVKLKKGGLHEKDHFYSSTLPSWKTEIYTDSSTPSNSFKLYHKAYIYSK